MVSDVFFVSLHFCLLAPRHPTSLSSASPISTWILSCRATVFVSSRRRWQSCDCGWSWCGQAGGPQGSCRACLLGLLCPGLTQPPWEVPTPTCWALCPPPAFLEMKLALKTGER